MAQPASALTRDDLSRQVEEFLRDQAAAYPGEPRVAVTPPQIDRMPACEQSEIFLPSQGRLRSRMTVGIRCLAPKPWVSYTQAELGIEGNYYVASRSLDAGTAVTPDDVAVREGDLLRLAPGTIYDAERLFGSITTQRIGTGSPLRERVLRSPDSIARGQAVRLEARGVGFVASSDGTALQGGEPGTRIQVRAASGQTVSGTVLNGQTVLVLM
ncbi:flagellar basal body P-ring formation chaperone FlgA [Pusillimonas sp.]|uniref:flagellar basal body P-ring formation chaperone FlgA n=1 Tax=Pusillimonas sp. TaxID=3040095 RepID=UPI0029B43BE0|nr:flagellar basal body P-ring formation chaperone FlgA [Pusillimonas sp.]MDX3894090.1 flagellar basal body P-ring formation chaperone FlgA [Pusillimonas sp.]